MAFVYFSRQVTKARRRGNGPLTPDQLAKLNEKMANAFTIDFQRGVELLKQNITREQMEKAVRSKDYKAVTRTRSWQKLGDHLKDAADRIGDTTQAAGKMAEANLPRLVRERLNYDPSNPKMDAYLEQRTGALVEYVTDDMKENVKIAVRMGEGRRAALDRLTEQAQTGIQAATRRAFEEGATARDVADEVREQLRQSIGLNSRQAQALANYDGPDKDGYAERLLDQRAMMIARTEISFASNQGQLDVWQAAQEQGLLPDGAKKVWIVDGDPCPFICEPMDGVAVGIDEIFTLPDGAEVDGPPAHPNCFCNMAISLPGESAFGPTGDDA